jgi:MFS family permease
MLILILGVSPILAPTTGSCIIAVFGWPMVFVALAIVRVLVLFAVIIWLSETKSPTQHFRLNPVLYKRLCQCIKTTETCNLCVCRCYSFCWAVCLPTQVRPLFLCSCTALYPLQSGYMTQQHVLTPLRKVFVSPSAIVRLFSKGIGVLSKLPRSFHRC